MNNIVYFPGGGGNITNLKINLINSVYYVLVKLNVSIITIRFAANHWTVFHHYAWNNLIIIYKRQQNNATFMLESHLKLIYIAKIILVLTVQLFCTCTYSDILKKVLSNFRKSLLEWWRQLLNSDISSPKNLSTDLLWKKAGCPSIFLYSLIQQ